MNFKFKLKNFSLLFMVVFKLNTSGKYLHAANYNYLAHIPQTHWFSDLVKLSKNDRLDLKHKILKSQHRIYNILSLALKINPKVAVFSENFFFGNTEYRAAHSFLLSNNSGEIESFFLSGLPKNPSDFHMLPPSLKYYLDSRRYVNKNLIDMSLVFDFHSLFRYNISNEDLDSFGLSETRIESMDAINPCLDLVSTEERRNLIYFGAVKILYAQGKILTPVPTTNSDKGSSYFKYSLISDFLHSTPEEKSKMRGQVFRVDEFLQKHNFALAEKINALKNQRQDTEERLRDLVRESGFFFRNIYYYLPCLLFKFFKSSNWTELEEQTTYLNKLEIELASELSKFYCMFGREYEVSQEIKKYFSDKQNSDALLVFGQNHDFSPYFANTPEITFKRWD